MIARAFPGFIGEPLKGRAVADDKETLAPPHAGESGAKDLPTGLGVAEWRPVDPPDPD